MEKHQYSLYSLIRLCNVVKIDLTEVLPKITKESFKPSDMNIEEITTISNILMQTSLSGYRDLESTNTGSAYKSKSQIINEVCSRSRKLRRINSTLHSCLQWLLEGASIEDFYNYKLSESLRANQPEQDRLDTMEELEILTEYVIDVLP